MNEKECDNSIQKNKLQCKIEISKLTNKLHEEIEKVTYFPKMNNAHKKIIINNLNTKYRENVTNILKKFYQNENNNM